MQFTKLFDHVVRMHSYNNVDLSLLARCVYCDFAALDANGMAIYPSNGYIATKYGVNERTVMRAIKELQDAGLIKGTIRKNTTKLYTVLVKPEDLIVAKAKAVATEKVEVVEMAHNEVVVATVVEEVVVEATSAEEFLAKMEATPKATNTAEAFLAQMNVTTKTNSSIAAAAFLASMNTPKATAPSMTAEAFLATMNQPVMTAESFLAQHTIH